MNKTTAAFAGAAIGAATMYMLDPSRGPAMTARDVEVEQLLKGVEAVAGVASVEHRLERHRDGAHISALQGPGPRTVPSAPIKWLRWTPTTRLVTGLAGLALVALSSSNRPIRGAATGITGLELLERALLGKRVGT